MAVSFNITKITNSVLGEKAATGNLCVLTLNSFAPEAPYRIEPSSEACKGTGLCVYKAPNTLFFNSGGVTYEFYKNGTPANAAAQGTQYGPATPYALWLVTSVTGMDTTSSGSSTNSSSTAQETVAPDGSITPSTAGSALGRIFIDSLNARDEFAVQALRELMSHVDNPDSFNKDQQKAYCLKAYEWAECMMRAAADARSKIESAEQESVPAVAVGNLTDNKEKLLNNIIAALERTDIPDYAGMGTWQIVIETTVEEVTTVELRKVSAPYTDAGAKIATGDPNATIATAEALGWSWVADQYKERVNVEGAALTEISNVLKRTDIQKPPYENIAEAEADGWHWTDVVGTTPAYWSKTDYANVAGAYTDAVAQTLPSGFWEGISAPNIEAWLNKTTRRTQVGEDENHNPIYEYSRLASVRDFPDVFNEYINQQRGRYNTAPSGQPPVYDYYNESLFEHYLRGIINGYIAHTPSGSEPPTKTTVGLDDLIEAIKDSQATDLTNLIAAVTDLSTKLTSINTNLTNINNAITVDLCNKLTTIDTSLGTIATAIQGLQST